MLVCKIKNTLVALLLLVTVIMALTLHSLLPPTPVAHYGVWQLHLTPVQNPIKLKAELKLAQESAKFKYDTHWAPAPIFKIGDLVMLS